MNSPEGLNPGDHDPDRGPEIERLQPGEIDLTGMTPQDGDLLDVIGDALIEAQGSGGEVPEWGARALARYLANRHEGPPGALHHFAVTGRIDATAMFEELADLWAVSERPRNIEASVNWLGTWLLAEQRRQRAAAESSYSETTQALIAEHGNAYAAFLTLPDVTEATAPQTFHEAFICSYDHIDQVVADAVEGLDLERELEESRIDHFASIDPAKVLRMTREAFDLVYYKGRWYRFDK